MLVGLTGNKGSGKSSVAALLHNFGYLPKVVAFAAPMKEMLLTLGVPYDNLYGSLKEEPLPQFGGVTGRYLMQTLGTEWGRNLICTDLWIRAFENTVKRELERGVLVVCDDVRFVEEYECIQRLGGKIVKIERPGLTNSDMHESENIPNDAWECETLVNDSTLTDLAWRLSQVLKK